MTSASALKNSLSGVVTLMPKMPATPVGLNTKPPCPWSKSMPRTLPLTLVAAILITLGAGTPSFGFGSARVICSNWKSPEIEKSSKPTLLRLILSESPIPVTRRYGPPGSWSCSVLPSGRLNVSLTASGELLIASVSSAAVNENSGSVSGMLTLRLLMVSWPAMP